LAKALALALAFTVALALAWVAFAFVRWRIPNVNAQRKKHLQDVLVLGI
jgi:hypothetical protein